MKTLSCSSGFPLDTELNYDIETSTGSVFDNIDGALYPGETRPVFFIPSKTHKIAHGSCRHPHHNCKDALVTLDQHHQEVDASERAELLIMSGDQIYADDVSGPLMWTIRETIKLLGLYDQPFEDAPFSSCRQIDSALPLYGREPFLPKKQRRSWLQKVLNQPAEPVFSSRTLDNHLLSFNEYFAHYLLVWSPAIWELLPLPDAEALFNGKPEYISRWQTEASSIMEFVAGLHHVRRLFIHTPSYMIFDDHDITDDFNLTVGWEKEVYATDYGNRIISNALLAYYLCQGWGNHPASFNDVFSQFVSAYFSYRTEEALRPLEEMLKHFEQWHYTIPTTPKIVVMDTRTRRWRSESNDNKPSGLMDWEALMDFQQDVLNHEAVIVVSAAPIFGVKFIETIQRTATLLGQPLATDSENWMAHPGSANGIMNIFKHPRTPHNFIVLSGDVHYSFAYDIMIRFRKSSPRIWQITCSGLRNQFPQPYLDIFEWLDRMLFGTRSPLNIFTRRKRMRIVKRLPSNNDKQYLVNSSAVGLLMLNDDGSPKEIALLTADNSTIHFPERPNH
ncbi:alkaline phosphatase family protein [Veronia pacifica]|nr:alkaline phosphatase family protein [Veronia pacifica]